MPSFCLGSGDDPAVLDLEDVVIRADEAAVMGDDDQGATPLLLLLAQEGKDLVTPFVIEVARGLIGEEHGRVLDQGAGDRHALLLAAGELGRLVLEPVAQADLPEDVFGALRASPA